MKGFHMHARSAALMDAAGQVLCSQMLTHVTLLSNWFDLPKFLGALYVLK